VPYFEADRRIGHYPALLADVVDETGRLVTTHVTYLENGRKLAGHEPRKLLSGLCGRQGCAARLMPLTGEDGVRSTALGIAEGIETALSAALLHTAAGEPPLPVWAALNAGLLARFEPPPGITSLDIFADRDAGEVGLKAAQRLVARLAGRIACEVHLPAAPHKDFNDQLRA
jgi:putative DNA primase/helicase